ncbi:MAG: hypothetical protein JO133_10655 [Burkholderiaceae bacterium]|nr:hypothetical protein [Burkholderiaceae bacterium]
MMRTVTRFVLLVGLLCGAFAAWADEERPYSEGPVISVSYIRTRYGMFDEYMKFLDSSYKKLLDEYKKAGLILDYGVYTTAPHNPHEPDIILTVTFKNWGAFDGLRDKTDPIDKQVYGSIEASNKGAVERDKVREVLGIQVMQKLILK